MERHPLETLSQGRRRMTALAGDTFISSAAMQKSALRTELRRRRRAIGTSERRRAARRTAHLLLNLRRVRAAHHVAVYLPLAHELDTRPLIRDLLRRGTQVYAPFVDWRKRMHFAALTRLTHLRKDSLGLAAPMASRSRRSPRRLDLIILPLLGFDACGHRLGMGAGYYDRSLAFQRVGSRPWRVGYAYPQQQIAALPAEPWDVRLDAVALSNGIRRLTQGAKAG